MTQEFCGKGMPLSQSGFDAAQDRLGASSASLWSLVTVETRGFGFFDDRRPKILFERHIFRKRTNARFDASDPDLSAATPGGYSGGTAEYTRLARAMLLDRRAALESASWGLGQIMGFNATGLGYDGAEDMVQRFMGSEDAQLDGTVRFITQNQALAKAFCNSDWKKVAFFYNGAAYATNQYDVKLQRFSDLYALRGVPSIAIRGAQAQLAYLGFDPHGIDGAVGNGTRAAILAFQASNGLQRNGELDDDTQAALDRLAQS